MIAALTAALVLNDTAPSSAARAGSSQIRPGAAPPLDLGGTWLLTMPRGFEYEARLERIDDTAEYRLICGATMLRGGYKLCGRRLTMARAEDEQMAGLVWEVKNKNVLVLIEHPEKSQFGSDYRNATLSRQKPVDEPR
jgi:hypothetical protein